MPTPRHLLVDASRSGAYHLISRCVRRGYLAGDGYEHRRQWIAEQIQTMTGAFAVDVFSWTVLGNHFHLVVKTHPEEVAALTPLEIAERWYQACPRRDRDGVIRAPTPEELELITADPVRVAVLRERLASLSWYMKLIKERLARRANREDRCTGHFWEARFKSIALLDQAAVTAAMAYVDLNPIRARLADTPESSAYTSVQERICARQRYERAMGLRTVEPRLAPALLRAVGLTEPRHPEDGLWIAPLSACTAGGEPLACRALTLDDYLELVDATGRVLRQGKRGAIPSHLQPILDRLQIDTDAWLAAMRSPAFVLGTAVGSLAARLREAARRGVAWIVDKAGLHKSTADPPPAPA